MTNTPYLDKFGEDDPEFVSKLLDTYWDARESELDGIEGDKEKEQRFIAEIDEEKTLFIALRKYGATKEIERMSFEDIGSLVHNKSIIERIEKRNIDGLDDLIKMLHGASAEINGILKAYLDK